VDVGEIIDSDNDLLAARMPRLIEADLLVVLTTAEGIYVTSPRKGGGVIPLVDDIDSLATRILKNGLRKETHSLASKIRAAQWAASEGVPTVVASGIRTGVLSNILDDETLGTLLLPSEVNRSRRKWIVDDLEPKGTLQVSSTAQCSLIKGNHSLMASDVQRSTGSFKPGDAVKVVDEFEKEFARGLISYSIDDLSRIQGKELDDIERLLGYKHYEEVIRRDDLVIL
jgi:glutamate 5-kinase